MKFDLHCHTSNGSIDGQVEIQDYIRLLRAHGIDGMLITDHNSYRGFRAFQKMKEKTHKYDNFVVLKGVEYDTLDAGHFIVIMPDAVTLRILEVRGMPLTMLIKIVHGYGGILGPAHPYGAKFLSAMHSKRLAKKPELIYEFDFIEIFNTCALPIFNAKAKALAEKYHLIGFAGSDAHKDIYVGTAYTEIDYDIKNNNDFINSLRLKRVVACVGAERETVQRGFFTRLLPIGLAWKIYNRGLGLLKAHSRKINLRKLSQN